MESVELRTHFDANGNKPWEDFNRNVRVLDPHLINTSLLVY